jgi:hypothetical protein
VERKKNETKLKNNGAVLCYVKWNHVRTNLMYINQCNRVWNWLLTHTHTRETQFIELWTTIVYEVMLSFAAADLICPIIQIFMFSMNRMNRKNKSLCWKELKFNWSIVECIILPRIFFNRFYCCCSCSWNPLQTEMSDLDINWHLCERWWFYRQLF